MAAEQALLSLQQLDFNLSEVSVIGRGDSNVDGDGGSDSKESSAAGLFLTGHEPHYLGKQATFWDDIGLLLDDTAFFCQPGQGALMVAGKMVSMMADGLQGMDIAGGFSLAGAAFYMAGIPRQHITEYEQMIQGGKLMLLVQGTRQLIDEVCVILNNKENSVTVHSA